MKPILFNTPMVRAILDGHKTVTRRVVKASHLRVLTSEFRREHPEVPDAALIEKLCEPPYQRGDILYVRETWTKLFYSDPDGYTHYDQPMYYYAADGTPDIRLVDDDGREKDDQRIRWHPSIHMPKDSARLFLRVTDVRVERLQDMTSYDAYIEGVRKGEYGDMQKFYTLWDSTIKPTDRERYGWTTNPWVWVIAFERCERPEVTHGPL